MKAELSDKDRVIAELEAERGQTPDSGVADDLKSIIAQRDQEITELTQKLRKMGKRVSSN